MKGELQFPIPIPIPIPTCIHASLIYVTALTISVMKLTLLEKVPFSYNTCLY